jgi:hypothetical protein
MGMEWEAAIEGFAEYVREFLPKATVGEDNFGQLIIYTNLQQDVTTGRIVPFEESIPNG